MNQPRNHHHRAAFLAANAVEQLGVAFKHAERAAALLEGKPGRVHVRRAAALVHAAVHDVQAAEHGDADFHVKGAASLLLTAAYLAGTGAASEHIASACRHLRAGFEAYDQANAILVAIEEGR